MEVLNWTIWDHKIPKKLITSWKISYRCILIESFQFLGRRRRLKEGDNDEKWGEIDETLQKLDQKLRDSGRPDQGTKKVLVYIIMFIIVP